VTDRLAGLVQEQHSVRSSLLDHLRVGVVAVRPSSGILVVGVRNQAREVGLLVARGGIVESEEPERETGNCDVEASLSEQSVCCLLCMRERRLCGSCSGLTYAEALIAGRVVRVAGTVASMTALDLGSHTARGAQSCSLKGLHVVWANQWAYICDRRTAIQGEVGPMLSASRLAQTADRPEVLCLLTQCLELGKLPQRQAINSRSSDARVHIITCYRDHNLQNQCTLLRYMPNDALGSSCSTTHHVFTTNVDLQSLVSDYIEHTERSKSYVKHKLCTKAHHCRNKTVARFLIAHATYRSRSCIWHVQSAF
jgi:hypothetical protein